MTVKQTKGSAVKRKPSQSVGGRPIGKVNRDAWKRYEVRRRQGLEVSEGTSALLDVAELNLDDGTNEPARKPKGKAIPTHRSTKPRELGIDALAGWTDKQPWWVQLPMWQFVIAPLWAFKLLFWMLLFGIVLSFMSSSGG